ETGSGAGREVPSPLGGEVSAGGRRRGSGAGREVSSPLGGEVSAGGRRRGSGAGPGRQARAAGPPPLKPVRVDGRQADARDIAGRVLTHDLGSLRKGTVLGPEHLAAVRSFSEVHLARLEPGDIHEDEAAIRLGRAVAGPGV